MLLLGLDPGLATTGYALISYKDPSSSHQLIDFGIIQTPKHEPLSTRLATIQEDLSGLIEKYEPDLAIIEKLFFAKNTKTALDVAQARGVLIATLQAAGVKIREITPNQVKLSLTGDGAADKAQIQKMLRLTLKLKQQIRPDDAADAVAIGLSYRELQT